MLAVIKTGGKQYFVSVGKKIKIEKMDKEVGEEISFSEVLLLKEKDGKLRIGTPLIKGAKVRGKVVAQKKGEKVIVFKYRPRKRYKVKKGHRQPYTEVEIIDIQSE